MAAPPVVYLHIGAMKTGTTFLQGLMRRHKNDLDGEGVLFPGRTWRDQAYGVREVLDRTLNDPVLIRQCRGAWARVTDEMLEYDGHSAVLSMEFLSQATEEQVQRVVGSFADRGAEVHAILTVRDTTRLLPAQWQTQCRNGARISWPDFMHDVLALATPWRRASGTGARTFAKAQDVPTMLQRWCRAVPSERVHVITVPGSNADPMLLWKRFASVVGVDPSVCWSVPDRSNPSLGHASADLMRRINAEIGRVPFSESTPVLKRYLANEVLAPRAPQERPVKLDRAGVRFAARWNRRIVRAVEGRQVQIVGDLGDLPTHVSREVRASSARRLTNPTDDELLDAAGTAFDGLQRWISQRSAGDDGPESADREGGSHRWRNESDPVAAATRELAELARAAMRHKPVPQIESPATS